MIPEPVMDRSKAPALVRRGAAAWLGAIFLAAIDASAESLDATHNSTLPIALPDTGAAILRVCGAFFVVVALFLGGVWLFRNWQRLAMQKSGAAKLNLIEVKSLGQRQAIYVVGYQQQRMLLASSPAGVTLLSHLPSAGEEEKDAPATSLNFAEALKHVLSQRQ
jgi:flagellar biogenesis protein FliO